MFRSVTALAFGLSLIVVLLLAHPAAANTTEPAFGSADGEEIDSYIDEDGSIVGVWVAIGDGTVIGKHVTMGEARFNPLTGELTGEFFSYSLEHDGTTVSGTYSGVIAQIPGTTITLQMLIVEWGGGTGLLQDVSGIAQSRGVEDETGGEFGFGSFHYDYHGFFRLP